MRRYTFVDVYGWRQIIFDKRTCPFLDERLGRCRVYSVRPAQCRTFPFWKEMFGPRGWTAEARSLCEGLDRGRRYHWSEIELYLREMEDWESV